MPQTLQTIQLTVQRTIQTSNAAKTRTQADVCTTNHLKTAKRSADHAPATHTTQQNCQRKQSPTLSVPPPGQVYTPPGPLGQFFFAFREFLIFYFFRYRSKPHPKAVAMGPWRPRVPPDRLFMDFASILDAKMRPK